MSIPDPYLSPASQPWGRWVTQTLRNYLAKRAQYDLDTQNSIRQLNIAIPQPMRGMLWNQTGTTVTIATAGVYVPLGLAGTLDTDGTFQYGCRDGKLFGVEERHEPGSHAGVHCNL